MNNTYSSGSITAKENSKKRYVGYLTFGNSKNPAKLKTGSYTHKKDAIRQAKRFAKNLGVTTLS